MIKEILICHKGKSEKLDVRNHGYFSTWDPEGDTGWLEYQDARDIIRQHKWLDKILSKLGII